MEQSNIILADSIEKRFGGVHALKQVSVGIKRGTIHGLVGENGAGKSTLGRIFAGALLPDSGKIIINGEPVNLREPRDALRHGIAMIAQELMVIPQMTVIENVYLGHEISKSGRLKLAEMHRRYDDLQSRYGLTLPRDALAGQLRVADQQKVEILRTLARESEIMIMDEPTAALPAADAERLFEIVSFLRGQGKTIIYVSHFLREVLSLADNVTVLKDGALVRTSPAANETPDSLVHAMLGQAVNLGFPDKAPTRSGEKEILNVQSLTRAPSFSSVSLKVRRGEIVGLAGLVGSGRSEVARAIYAADHFDSGQITFDGQPVKFRAPHEAIAAGMALLPESRKEQGLLLKLGILDNVSLPYLERLVGWGFIRKKLQRSQVRRIVEKLKVKASSLETPVHLLSGGNQQKVLLGRWILGNPKLLIADEPTRGVDVGAKKSIYSFLNELASSGTAILLISSEMEEILGLATRVYVMKEGHVVAEFEGNQVTEPNLMKASFGITSAIKS